MFLPQNEILRLLPATVQFAKPAVAVTARLLGAILLPKQWQREVRMFPEFVLQGDKVRAGRSIGPVGRPRRFPNNNCSSRALSQSADKGQGTPVAAKRSR